MSLVNDIRRTVTDTTPVYAAVGATDLAVEKVRGARVFADFHVSAFQGKAIQRAEQVAEQAQALPALAQALPALALNQTLEVAGKAQATYAELAVRGEKLVKRVRNQKSTKDLFAQAGSTVSYGKGAVTTVKKAAVDTTRAAKTTLNSGRHEAGVAVGAVAKSVRGEVITSTRAVRNSGPAVRLASKRPAAAAKKSTATAKTATKATATSAATTVTKAAEAVKTATPKIGD
jgi:hypothetical protein